MGYATVLCIDDNPSVLKLRKATLESCGYRVEIASSGDTCAPQKVGTHMKRCNFRERW